MIKYLHNDFLGETPLLKQFGRDLVMGYPDHFFFGLTECTGVSGDEISHFAELIGEILINYQFADIMDQSG